MLLAMVGVLVAAVGVVASVIGVYAYFEARRDRRVKALAFSRAQSISLATARSLERGYELSIHYRAPGMAESKQVEAAWAAHLRFANFGKEPIRGDDIARASPLRIEVEGRGVLDISLTGARRSVSRVAIGPPQIEDDCASAAITFDFLDHRDGGVVTILSTSPLIRTALVGEIIGMPRGIIDADVPAARGLWSKLGVALTILAELAAFAAAAYVTKVVAGSWADIWLLTVPIAALVIPLLLAGTISDTVWPSRSRKFSGLPLPAWARPFGPVPVRPPDGSTEWFPGP